MHREKKMRGAALIGEEQLQHADHLLPLCHLLNLPCYMLSADDNELCQTIYPGVDLKLIDYRFFTPELLIEQHELLLFSEFWKQNSFYEAFKEIEKSCGKHLKKVYCPHGFSDKSFYLRHCKDEEYSLLYGQNMVDMLKEIDSLPQNYAVVGNYRERYYNNFKRQLDHTIDTLLEGKLPHDAPIALYAPTWDDAEGGSTLMEHSRSIIKGMPDGWSLIIKPHPRSETLVDEQDSQAYFNYQRLLGEFESHRNLLFLERCPLIYPLLNRCSVYIGDTSSVGFDFLYFNRPLYLIDLLGKQRQIGRSTLFDCGETFKADEVGNLWQSIEKQHAGGQDAYEAKRQKMYDYTFGSRLELKEVAERVWQMLNNLQ